MLGERTRFAYQINMPFCESIDDYQKSALHLRQMARFALSTYFIAIYLTVYIACYCLLQSLYIFEEQKHEAAPYANFTLSSLLLLASVINSVVITIEQQYVVSPNICN